MPCSRIHHHHHHVAYRVSYYSTATAEGITMTKVLSTFHQWNRVVLKPFEAIDLAWKCSFGLCRTLLGRIRKENTRNVKSRQYLGVPSNDNSGVIMVLLFVKNAKSESRSANIPVLLLEVLSHQSSHQPKRRDR